MRALDHSQLQCYRACPQRYQYQYGQGLVRCADGGGATAPGRPAAFGTGIHGGMEAFYKGLEWPAIVAGYTSSYPPATAPAEGVYAHANGLVALEAYREWATLNDPPTWKVLGTEILDTWELDPELPPYQVKVDLLVEDPVSGIWAVDHKTTSKDLGELFWQQFEPNSQVSGYIAWVKQRYGQCAGLYINAIKVGYRSRAYRGEPPGFYCQFQRQAFHRTEEQLASWKLNTVRWMRKLMAAQESGVFERHEGQCGWCQYRELCLSERNPDVMASLYSKCDPYAYLKPSGVSDE